jgi:hypothetical protein
VSFLERIRRWFAKPAIDRAEEEQHMSAAERAELEEGAEGLAADVHAEERFGPLPHEHDTD